MNIERKLASIRKITNIQLIPNADRIVCASIDGWKVVTQKSNNFQIGDLVVFFEIDSFIPVSEKFEFLRKSSFTTFNGQEGFRLKTIKLKGIVSQGLILPIHEVLENTNVSEGDDLTDILGVKKWESTHNISLGGDGFGLFPHFIPKTNSERIQNVMSYLDKNVLYEVSLKLDGTSLTIYKNEEHVGVCSRNQELKDTDNNVYWRVSKSSGLFDFLKGYPENIAIQSEILGPGVQGNRENFYNHRIYIFDIFSIDEQRYFTHEERITFCENFLNKLENVFHVPIIDVIDLNRFNDIEGYLEYADIRSIHNEIAEGVVFKDINGVSDSFKVINNRFLLK